MSNMSYCRFQNTLMDLQDCQEVLDEMTVEEAGKLSDEERRAATKLVNMCRQIGFDADNGSFPV